MQRVAGQYVVKRFADQLLGSEDKAGQAQGQPQEQPPYQPQYQPAPQQGPAPAATAAGGELDGTMVYDDDDERLGIARHVGGVSVYVVSHSPAEPHRTLRQAIEDPDMELRLATDANGRLTGLIYVPASARANQSIRGTRSDDV